MRVHMSRDEKKRGERWLIEEARRRSTIFPAGDLTIYESPDWLIQSAFVGIEVSELLRPRRAEQFSGAQLHSFQSDVVKRAWRFYCRQGWPDVDVLVFFQNEWNRKRDPQEYGVALAQHISRNLPEENGIITLSCSNANECMEGTSVIRISRRIGGRWQAGGAADGVQLEYLDIASRIASKNARVPLYRTRVPGFAIWLLLTTNIRVLRSVGIPREIASWRFTFDFDKVLLMPWDDDVIELTQA